jgi:hypothetical protein
MFLRSNDLSFNIFHHKLIQINGTLKVKNKNEIWLKVK